MAFILATICKNCKHQGTHPAAGDHLSEARRCELTDYCWVLPDFHCPRWQAKELTSPSDELRVLRSIAEGDEDGELFGTSSENAKRIAGAIRKLQVELVEARYIIENINLTNMQFAINEFRAKYPAK